MLGLYALVEKALTDRCSTTERLNAAVVERLDREYQREFERAGNAHWETCKFVALRGDRLLERQVRETPGKLAQTLGQLQSFTAASQQECMGRPASFGPT